MFDMINIFEVFLPQLLRYPNPTDPLNGEAAALLMREPKRYEERVKGEHLHHGMYVCAATDDSIEYVTQYATRAHLENDEDGEEDDGELSEVEDFRSDHGDEEPAGHMEV